MPGSTAAGSSAPSATRPTIASTGTSSAAAAEQKALIHDSPGHQQHPLLHLCRTHRRGGDAGRRAAGPGRQAGRPRDHLHADGGGSGDRHARLRAHRRHSFGGVRRLCRAGAGRAHRGCDAGGHPGGILRHRAGPHRRLQAAARRRHRAVEAQAEHRAHAAAAHGRGLDDRRAATTIGPAPSPTPSGAAARPAASR